MFIGMAIEWEFPADVTENEPGGLPLHSENGLVLNGSTGSDGHGAVVQRQGRLVTIIGLFPTIHHSSGFYPVLHGRAGHGSGVVMQPTAGYGSCG